MSDARLITARTLLLGFLELRGMTPELADWTEERLAGNPPRLVRLRRLMALFRAFGLPWDPQSFSQGNFIEPDDPRHAALLARLAEEMPKGARNRSLGHQLPHFFRTLFDYRLRVEDVLSCSSGVLEASGLYLHAHRKVRELNRVIRDHLASVEDTLAALISPESASFSVEQLTREFGYPDDDLFEVDLDGW